MHQIQCLFLYMVKDKIKMYETTMFFYLLICHYILAVSTFLLIKCVSYFLLNRKPTIVDLGSDAILGRCIFGCCCSGERYHWVGSGTRRDDGSVKNTIINLVIYY